MEAKDVARRSVAGAAIFMVAYAVVAALWRRVAWASTYEDNGFFDFNEPSALIVLGGLASYFFASLFMAMLYGHMFAAARTRPSPRIFFILGALFWIVSDFGYIGRHDMTQPGLFLALEAVLVAGAFLIWANVLPRLFARTA